MEYADKIKQIIERRTTDLYLKKAQSQAILQELCPFCEYFGKCENTVKKEAERQMCILKSTETMITWLYLGDIKPKIEIGQQYGNLIVEKFSHKTKNGKLFFSCKCECGRSIVVRSDNLLSGNTTSCGCLRGKSNTKISLRRNVSLLVRGKKSRKYNIGSSINPDGTRHVLQSAHHSKVGCTTDKLVDVKDEDDPHDPTTNYKFYIDATCYVCKGKLRYNHNAERQCEDCNTIN